MDEVRTPGWVLEDAGRDGRDGLVIHHRGRIAYANARLGALLGVSPRELRGRPALGLYPEPEYAAVLARLQTAAFSGRPPPDSRHRLRRSDGRLVEVKVSLYLLPSSDDAPLVVEIVRPAADPAATSPARDRPDARDAGAAPR